MPLWRNGQRTRLLIWGFGVRVPAGVFLSFVFHRFFNQAARLGCGSTSCSARSCFLPFVFVSRRPSGRVAPQAEKKTAGGRWSGGLPPAQASSTNLPPHSHESHLPCRTTSARIPHTPTHAPIRDSNHRPCSTVRPRTPKAPKRETGKKMRCVSDFSGESVYRKPHNLAEGDLTGLCKIRFLTVRTSR